MKNRDERLKDILEHPGNHRHEFSDLTACCMVNGALDTSLMQAHSENAPLGKNGGTACDVTSGPCACGAWH